jgi:hypothetical protein
MPAVIRILLFALLFFPAQEPPRASLPDEKPDVRLPNGKSQRREILKADFEKSKADAAELADLSRELKEDLDKADPYVLDVRTLKKAEEIEKLAKRIKDRMKRHL